MASARAERRSVNAYEHVLGVLGDVTKRSEAVANIHPPTPGELARPHVHQSSGSLRPVTSGLEQIPPARIHLEPPVLPSRAGHRRVFEHRHNPISREPQQPKDAPSTLEDPSRKAEVEFAETLSSSGVHPAQDPDLSDSTDLTSVSEADRDCAQRQDRAPKVGRVRKAPQDRVSHRAATGAVAAVALGALAVGGWQLVARQSDHGGSLSNVAQGAHASGASSTGHSLSNPAVPPSIQPLSSSGAVVAYSVPYSSYSISFQTTGRCWIGVSPSAQPSGAYSAMQTVEAGGTWSYQADGAVVVRIGAPNGLTIEVNGVVVVLPPGRMNPYDITLTPTPSASA